MIDRNHMDKRSVITTAGAPGLAGARPCSYRSRSASTWLLEMGTTATTAIQFTAMPNHRTRRLKGISP